jgi:hypothetical protein
MYLPPRALPGVSMGRGSESLSRGSIKLTQRNDLSRVLLATWKAEIRRILVQGQPWPKKKKKSNYLEPISKRNCVVVPCSKPRYLGSEIGGLCLRLSWARCEILSKRKN